MKRQSTPVSRGNGTGLMSAPIRALMSSDPSTIAPGESVREAARRMRERNISCLPVCRERALVGIVTLRDLRDKVVADDLSGDTPVEAVMSRDVVSVPVDGTGFDALLLMSRKGVAHLPVHDDGRLVGIVTNTDFLRKQTASAVYMASDIGKCDSVDGIAAVVARVPELLLHLVDSGAHAEQIGHLVSAISDAATRRLLALARSRLGAPPIDWAWLACGSQGREEQSGVSDQDNCLILSDDFDAQAHGAYYEALARFVNDGLNASGYAYCPGEMMASNPRWRQPLATWRHYFRSWIEQPEPMAQMLASVMFDLRVIDGNPALHGDLQRQSLERARGNGIFVAHMVSNSLTHRPPLGLFGGLSIARRGEHAGTVDLKLGGVVPITDIARVFALSAASPALNTWARLRAARGAGLLSESGSRDLLDAFGFIADTRLRHQAEQARRGEKPDNHLAPSELSGLERRHLRDAFRVVKTIQASLSSRHQIGAR
ncbi:DUF294 nucleotidyltransferase-like domain-containing protein [Burkholderiaceae bacterium FT117]|uniref:putative nucleotidyltransferase substrate binding domain-containing protein n=1 Tax=Zeimonas sediminis TaxID=2944268 RepID=UPI002342CE09|nr:putative nucleotidyltransferase substrate binding domain-containing protein [Zeimonas sediminis]MCM5569478.1 DUF294 nucleotidyltransferase-like domain-containing protein [Zeimonas sediminis]